MTPSILEAEARAWCDAMAAVLEVQVIERAGRPYLERYFAAGWSPSHRHGSGSIYLHHFIASDAGDEVHSHPWGWSTSLILVGGYREHRCAVDGRVIVREFRPGDVNTIEAFDRHRIELLAADCWSVFLAGGFVTSWAFAPGCEGAR